MKGSPQPQTTSSTSQMAALVRSSLPKRVKDTLLLEAITKIPLGTLTMTGRIVRKEPKNERYIEALCSVCKEVSLITPSNILRGKSTGCFCQRNRKYDNDPRANVIAKRFSAMHQRCNTPHYAEYHNYGARGIKCLFTSCEEFVRWVLENLPHETYEGVQIDRKDNNRHYEPGNLRLVTQAENLRNKCTTHWVDYFGKKVVLSDLHAEILKDYPNFPIPKERVVKYMSLKTYLMTLEQVLLRGEITPQEIARRNSLMSTTS
jgi:hypothetical protein